MLNGGLSLNQGNLTIATDFISVDSPVVHEINLEPSDAQLLQKMAYFDVYWFLDCEYLEKTDSLSFVHQYNDDNKDFNLLALVVASWVPVSFKSKKNLSQVRLA